MKTVKVTCHSCGSAKNIPDNTCNWQCRSCSKTNTYTKPEPVRKVKPKKKFKPVKKDDEYKSVTDWGINA